MLNAHSLYRKVQYNETYLAQKDPKATTKLLIHLLLLFLLIGLHQLLA